MITFKEGNVTIEFDGTVAVGGSKTTDGRARILTLQNLKEKKHAGQAVMGDDLWGPEVCLWFTNTQSLDVVISQLTKLRDSLRGNE